MVCVCMYVCICAYVYMYVYIYVYIYIYIYMLVYMGVKKKFFNYFFISSTIVIKSGYFHMVGGFHASDGFSVLMEPPSQIVFLYFYLTNNVLLE